MYRMCISVEMHKLFHEWNSKLGCFSMRAQTLWISFVRYFKVTRSMHYEWLRGVPGLRAYMERLEFWNGYANTAISG